EEVGRQVFVAEREPRGYAVALERAEGGVGLAFETPTLGNVRRAGQRVGDRVEVGGDVEVVELVVVAGVDDRNDVGGRHDLHEPGEKAGGADAAGKGREHARDPNAGSTPRSA